MDLTLKRTDFRFDGIFGKIYSPTGLFLFFSLEHAYRIGEGFLPKIPSGFYECVRGIHRLEGQDKAFITFEITNVPGHTNILIHTGNTQEDSSGCVLIGSMRQGNTILFSKKAFLAFLTLESGIDMFTLTVE